MGCVSPVKLISRQISLVLSRGLVVTGSLKCFPSSSKTMGLSFASVNSSSVMSLTIDSLGRSGMACNLVGIALVSSLESRREQDFGEGHRGREETAIVADQIEGCSRGQFQVQEARIAAV